MQADGLFHDRLTGATRRFPPELRRSAQRKLQYLNAAVRLRDLAVKDIAMNHAFLEDPASDAEGELVKEDEVEVSPRQAVQALVRRGEGGQRQGIFRAPRPRHDDPGRARWIRPGCLVERNLRKTPVSPVGPVGPVEPVACERGGGQAGGHPAESMTVTDASRAGSLFRMTSQMIATSISPRSAPAHGVRAVTV